MRLVLDTSVIASAVRNRAGASAEVLALALEGHCTLLISVPLLFEYESVLMRQEHLQASGYTAAAVDRLLAAILARGEEVKLKQYAGPSSVDPGDNHILSLAQQGHSDAIVTFNTRHFLEPSIRLRVNLWTPVEALRALRVR